MNASLPSRERLLRALEHQEPDRVPIDFGGSSTTAIHREGHRRLCAYLGLPDEPARLQSVMTQVAIPHPRLQAEFGADVLLIDPGKPDAWELRVDPGSGEYTDEWGIRYRRPPGCLYYEYAVHPLREGTLEELERYRWPDPRDPGRYRGLAGRVKDLFENTDKALLVNNPFGIWEQCQALRGVENAMADLAQNQAYLEALAERLADWQAAYWEEMLSRIGPYVQVIKLNDDLGWRGGPLISPRSYRRVFKPRHQALIRAIRTWTAAKVMLHSDGDIYPFLEDLKEIGVEILNPVEVTAREMESARLKREYGQAFVFWGGACSVLTMTVGEPEEVEQEARRRILDFAPGGGFVFAPIHNLQPNMPPENVVALFRAARKWGCYPLLPA